MEENLYNNVVKSQFWSLKPGTVVQVTTCVEECCNVTIDGVTYTRKIGNLKERWEYFGIPVLMDGDNGRKEYKYFSYEDFFKYITERNDEPKTKEEVLSMAVMIYVKPAGDSGYSRAFYVFPEQMEPDRTYVNYGAVRKIFRNSWIETIQEEQ